MPDIIHKLPDSVANQIAAGEVIQRPASALKEMLENAVDAGASEIRVIIKDAGKTLIQVTDNGCGMTDKDALLCFERHATSKIQDARDLFCIRTLGFRGEALASIAAIAQLEMKTRLTGQEMGTCIQIEGSRIIKNAPCQSSPGTTISVKNLFFNVPARRNFLKSNTAELRHIIDEFQRVALVNHNISMDLFHNNKPLFKLSPSNSKERIISILGNHYKERLLPIEQKTNEVSIHGYIGKPEFAKKTRGDQFFFTNGRFIRHPYLHHSVENALAELLPRETFPTYVIFIEVDPSRIDVNIHPTKTEVNFQDNQLIYAVLRSAIKQAIGKFNVTPTIDFDVEKSLDLSSPEKGVPIKNPFAREYKGYNPFESGQLPEKPSTRGWEKIYDGLSPPLKGQKIDQSTGVFPDQENESFQFLLQLKGKYIVTSVKSGMMVIDQEQAHQRILYEKFMKRLANQKQGSQQELFPQNITFGSSDSEIIKELIPDLEILGFSINHLSKNTFIINGIPEDFINQNMQDLLEGFLETYKRNLVDLNLEQRANLARSMAVKMSINKGKSMQREEMENLINELFSCESPELSPDGKKTLVLLPIDQLDQMFN